MDRFAGDSTAWGVVGGGVTYKMITCISTYLYVNQNLVKLLVIVIICAVSTYSMYKAPIKPMCNFMVTL